MPRASRVRQDATYTPAVLLPGNTAARSFWIALLIGALSLTGASIDTAQARKHALKGIWGEDYTDNAATFPVMRKLGAKLFLRGLHWNEVAPTRPEDPRDPDDPAYVWPDHVTDDLAAAWRNKRRVMLMLDRAPKWANKQKDRADAPTNPNDFADFAVAAARRYPHVHLWQIWGEPQSTKHFRPGGRKGARLYSRIVDASYRELKRLTRRNKIIGGNTFTYENPRRWIRWMKLPNGKPPRMDLYGHNPISPRRPDLAKRQFQPDAADFSDLDIVAKWLDRYLRRKGKPRLKIFVAEYSLPTRRFDCEWPFYLTYKAQHRFMTSALEIARTYKRVYGLGYIHLRDKLDPEDECSENSSYRWASGLLDRRGKRKPAFRAFRKG